MKIPTSSSILLASLAISSSSGALAAPTSEGNQADGGLSPSPSRDRLFNSRSTQFSSRSADCDNNNQPESFDKRDLPLLSQVEDTIEGLPIVGPLVGKIVSGILQAVANSPAGGHLAQALPQVTEDQLKNLKAAAGEVSRKIASATPPPPGQGSGNQTYPGGDDKDKDGKDKEMKEKDIKEDKDMPKDDKKPDDKDWLPKDDKKPDEKGKQEPPPAQQQQAPPQPPPSSAPPPTNTNGNKPPPTASVQGKDINPNPSNAPGSPAIPGNPPNSPAGAPH